MTKTIIQETLKVFIVAYTIIVLGGMLFIFIESFSRDTNADIYDDIFLVLTFFTGILSALFHVKTYKYYQKIKSKARIPKLFWVAALIFPSYILYTIYDTFVNFFYGTNATISQDLQGFIIFSLLAVFSVISILEAFFMFKRVQKQHEYLLLEQELEGIGDTNSQ